MTGRRLLVLGLVLSIAYATFASSVVAARNEPLTKPCKPVEAVFARGSGQPLRAAELDAYDVRLDAYTKNTDVDYNLYELGTAHQRGDDGIGYKYPAVAVVGSLKDYRTGGGAWLSSGHAHRYGKSVEDGVKELALYLNQRFTRPGQCQDSRIVLAGYSQGAQVIGQFAAQNSSWVNKSVRERIDYITLFGDPKLHLPEGRAPTMFSAAAACREQTDRMHYLSVWRATVPLCATHQGALAARKPYVTKEFLLKVSTWCNAKDFVCDERYAPIPLTYPGHGQYVNEGRIDEGVREALKWAAFKLANDDHKQQLLYSTRNDGARLGGSGKDQDQDQDQDQVTPVPPTHRLPYVAQPRLDVSEDYRAGHYSLPCTGYLAVDQHQPYVIRSQPLYPGGKTDDARYKANVMASFFLSEGCSVAVYSYDSFDTNSADFRLIQPATTDVELVEKAIYTAKFQTVEADVYQSRCSIGQHSWREVGFMRDIVIAQQPNPTEDRLYSLTGSYTLCPGSPTAVDELDRLYDVFDVNEKIHGWSVSPAVLDVIVSTPKQISDGTQTISPPGAKPSQQKMALFNQPQRVLPPGDFSVKFDLETYYAEVNDEVAITVRPANSMVGIHEYKTFYWDFNGDGKIDSVTDQPTGSYTYQRQYDGPVSVIAENLDGEQSRATTQMIARIDINQIWANQDLPAAPKNLILKKLSPTSFRLSWQPADNKSETWIVQLNDSPGERVILDKYEINMTEVDMSQPLTVRVRGVTSEGLSGRTAIIGWRPDGTVTSNDEYAEMLKNAPPPGEGTSSVGDSVKPADESSDKPVQAEAMQQPTFAQTTSAAFSDRRVQLVGGVVVAVLVVSGGVAGLLYHRRRLARQRDSVFVDPD